MKRYGVSVVLLAALLSGAVTAVLCFAVARWVFGAPYSYDLGRVNSVRPSTPSSEGLLCVNDRYDENHCREGQPLILPVEPLEDGDCVEVRTRRQSAQISVRVVHADVCLGGPYGSDR